MIWRLVWLVIAVIAAFCLLDSVLAVRYLAAAACALTLAYAITIVATRRVGR